MKRGGLKLGALALVAAGLIEHALQIILPVILVRHFMPADFGEYRLVWLLTASAVPLFVLSFPHSLFYTVKATALVLVVDKPVLAGLPLLAHLLGKVVLYCVPVAPCGHQWFVAFGTRKFWRCNSHRASSLCQMTTYF